MKATLEIPDAIFRNAKAQAAVAGLPLREYVTQAIAEKLSSHAKTSNKPWMECAGIAAHLHEETMRIDKIIEEAFEQIETEDDIVLRDLG